MGRHQKSQREIDAAREVFAASDGPVTLRQLYYRLASSQIIELSDKSYKRLSERMVNARRDEDVPWDAMEDRNRRPRAVSQWDDVAEFAESVRVAYRKNVWLNQPVYVECWLEKDALSGIFEAIIDEYGVTLNVGRGYDGWSSIHAAAARFGEREPDKAVILYFGDHDPSGVDMPRSLRERLCELGAQPRIKVCALTLADIESYELPPNPTKLGDSRRAKFVALHGELSVELDALPPEVLRQRIRDEVEALLDLEALAATREIEQEEREQIAVALGNL